MAVSRNRLSIDLIDQVGEFLAARLVPTGDLCLGLSGGCDSVVLLHVLSRLGFGDRLSAIHVHHGLSPNADRWADFCRDYCIRLSISLAVVRVDVDRETGLGLEAAAREARYEAFAACSAENIVLAHHQGDQAETVLFNLLRGTGVAGAAGIPAERRLGTKRLLRPLLAVDRLALEAYANAHDLIWVDDESNADLRYSRNYLRHELLPVLTQRFPAAGCALAQAASNFAEADALLTELAAADWLMARTDDGSSASLPVLRCLSLPRLKNLLRYRLRTLGWRAPAASRLDEFARQVLSAGPDRHPSLDLAEGCMRIARRELHWLSQK